MIDEDLNVLFGILRRMEPQAKISINHRFICSAAELLCVVEEAMRAREKARTAGTFQPFSSGGAR